MCICLFFFFFKQKTAYEMRISDWSSDVCSSDLAARLDSVRATRQSAAMPDASKTTSPTSAGAASGDADPLRAHGGFADLVGYALKRWEDRKSVVEGKSVSVRVDLGGRGVFKQKIHRLPI